MRPRVVIFWASMSISAATAASAQEQRPLLVGLLRVDCVALPFASYQSGRWERLPFSFVPPVAREFAGPWYFTARSGETASLGSGRLVEYTDGNSFYEEWGVQTDHRPCSTLDSFPVERIGIVLSEDLHAVAFREFTDSIDVQQRLTRLLTPEFDRLEEQNLQSLQADSPWRNVVAHPGNMAVRQQQSVQLTELYGSMISDTTFLYFVARRDYPPRPGVPLRPLSVLHGWATQHSGTVTLDAAELILDSGSEMQVSTYLPMAVVSVDATRYIIAELGGYEGSTRQVLQWTRTGPAPVLPEP